MPGFSLYFESIRKKRSLYRIAFTPIKVTRRMKSNARTKFDFPEAFAPKKKLLFNKRFPLTVTQ